MIEPELLDHVPPEVARPNLADLVRINRHWGGHSVLRKTLEKATRGEERFTLLDVGAASGDSGRLINELYPGASVINLDYSPTNLEAANPPKLVADAFQLPFADGGFDYVLCSLFLHHFTDEQVVSLLAGFHRAARKAVVICDLERNIIPYLFLPATRAIFGWNTITVHDGKISVRAAFRAPELRALALRAGMRGVETAVYRPAFRIGLIGRK